MPRPTRRHLLQVFAGAGALAMMPSALAAGPSAKGLIEDARLLQRIYAAMHPGLHRYNTPDEIAGHFDALRARLASVRSTGAAWLAFSETTAKTRCGHTQPNPWNQSDAVMAELTAGRTYLPFLFEWIGGRMIVSRALTADGALTPGTEVIALGREPASDLLNAMTPLARADGSNDAKRIDLLSLRGIDQWETFDLFLAQMRADLVAPGTLRLMLRGLDGAEREADIGLMTAAERLAALPPVPPKKDKPWDSAISADGVAWLKMPNWAFFNDEFDWEAALNAELDRIADAGPKALVVDVRSNEGGNSVGEVILARLIDRDRRMERARHVTRYRKVPDDLNAYLETWDKSFRDWGADAKGPDADGFYDMTRWSAEGGAILKPHAKPIAAKLVVVTDASNSSATFEFASGARALGVGTLIGQPTGGNRRGINGGAFFFIRLPNSGLECDLPLIAQFPETPQPDAGLIPDITVERRPADLASGRDAEREAVTAYLKA